MGDNGEIDALTELDVSELLARLYTEATGKEFGGDNFLAIGLYWSTSQRLTAILWLSDNFEKIYNAVCVEWRYCEKRRDPRLSDVTSLAGGIADIIGTLSLGIPTPATVSVLLVKLGMDRFCGCVDGAASRLWMDSVVDEWEAKAADKQSGYHRAYYAWWWLCVKNFSDGKIDEAQKHFKRALRLGGKEAQNDGQLWNEYSWKLVEAGCATEAVDAVKQAVKLSPNDPAIWDTLGLALLRAGRIHESINALTRSVDLDRAAESRWYGLSGQLEIRIHLVEAYVSVNLVDEAEDVVEDMVAIDSSSVWIARARQLIDEG